MNRDRLKVMTILGTRPEIIRLSRVMPALDEAFDHVLVHTGQNYDHELSQIFFDELRLRPPDRHLGAAGGTPAETIGQVIASTDRVLANEMPEAVLVLGDTNSCLAVIAAKRRKIPIFHMEAGNRCFDQRVPEEINRRIVDHTADINLPYSAIAREYLLAEGVAADRIVKTGSPMFEVLEHYRSDIDASDALGRLGLQPQEYFLVSCHREENVDANVRLTAFAEMLETVAEAYRLPVLLSAHPRTRSRMEELGLALDPRVRVMKPFGFLDYSKLQLHARVVLSDSGTISEEAAILGFPAVNIRDTHERPEAMEEATAMMTGLDAARVLQALAILERRTSSPRLPGDYAVPDVSAKVVRIIQGYTDYVRRTVWQAF